MTLGEALTYSGSFSEGADDTFVLSGGNLLLNGADTFAGGTVDGSNLLETEGTTTVSGLTIGGTAEWENTKAVNQSGGTVTIGDSSGDKAFLDNTAKGTYDIVDDSGIGRGSSTASYIENAGLFEKTGGTGTSTIAPAVTNTRNARGHGRDARFQGSGNRKGNGHDLGRFDLGIRRGGFEQHDGRLPEYRLHRRRHARSHRSHELLGRNLGLRGERHDRALGLMGVFQLLGEFRRHAGDADACKRRDQARLRLPDRRYSHARQPVFCCQT